MGELGKLTIIRANGSIMTESLDRAPTLSRLQEIVGGYIEVVPYFQHFYGEPCIAFCNEDGKLALPAVFPANEMATMLWRAQCRIHISDYLVGPVAIVTGAGVLRAMRGEEAEL